MYFLLFLLINTFFSGIYESVFFYNFDNCPYVSLFGVLQRVPDLIPSYSLKNTKKTIKFSMEELNKSELKVEARIRAIQVQDQWTAAKI